MAGHLSLKKQDEPTLFGLVETIKGRVSLQLVGMKDFTKFLVPFKSKFLTAMKLSKDYVEDPKTEVAFTLGKVNLKSITYEHKSLTHNIDVEVHLSLKNDKVEIKNIFWVA